MGSQVRNMHGRQNQKSAVTYNTIQIGTSSCFGPANIFVSFFHPPLCSTESQCSNKSMLRALHQVANLCTAQGPFAQIMESLHKSVPYFRGFAVAARNRNNLYRTKFVQSASEFRKRNKRIWRSLGTGSIETGFLGCG